MNKIYKLKYDRRRNQVVAVSELTAGAGKESTGQVAALAGLTDMCSFRKLPGTLTPLAFLTGLVMSLLPGIALANPDLPTGGQIVAGQGSISTNGNQMTISQNTHGLVTNWNTFDVGQNHTVQFVQPDSSAVALNRVTGGHESQILGTLTANGQVMLVNPAGVMFGKGATVNTAGLVASTKNISNADFMAGHYTFSGGSDAGAEVVNQGNLTTTKGGFIVLAADRVKNSGNIHTPGGKTVLAAGDKVTLQLDNTGLASVSVSGSVVNALVENSGLLSATDGRVYLTARGKDMLLNTVVNNTGTVEASGLSGHGGEIVLNGGDSGVVSQSGTLLADSKTGRGGKLTVEGQNIHLAANSRTSATGKTGGGEVYVGGGWQGKDSHIRNASKVVMDKSATIDVSATESGNGGSAVLWSDDYTNFRGTILAKGGTHSGNGGRVETSSHHNLQAFGDVDTSAVAGQGGNWLLDPLDVTIVSESSNTNVTETGKGTESKLDSDTDHVFSPSDTGAQVSAVKIAGQLNNGTSVTVDTHGEGDLRGNITFARDAKIQKTGGADATLTLKADGNITFAGGVWSGLTDTANGAITSTLGKLNLNLLTGNDGQNSSVTIGKWVHFFLNGGDFSVGPANELGGASLSLVDTALISAGNINLDTAGGTSGSNYLLNATGNLTVNGPLSARYGDRLKSELKAGNVVNITTASGNIEFNATDKNGGSILINGQNGVNIRTDNGSLVMKVTGNNNKISVTSDNGSVSLSGKVQNGGNGLALTGVNLSSKDNVTLNGTTFWGKGASLAGLNVSAGSDVNISGTAQRLSDESLGAADATEGLTITGSKITSGNGNISVSGLTASGKNASLKMNTTDITASAGKILLDGKSEADKVGASGVNVNGGNLSANSLEIKGVSTKNGTGFSLTGSHLNGNLTDLTNVTFSSAGSASGVTNNLDSIVVNDSNRNVMLSKSIDNLTVIDMNGTAVFDDGAEAWNQKYQSDAHPNVGWIFNNTTVNASGANLSGVGFTNSSLNMSAGDLIINNNGSVMLTNSIINVLKGSVTLNATGGGITLGSGSIATEGDINLQANNAILMQGAHLTSSTGGVTASTTIGNIDLTSGSNISADRDVNLHAANGAIRLRGNNGDSLSNITSLSGNINITAKNNSLYSPGVMFDNVSVAAGKGRIYVYGESHAGSPQIDNLVDVINGGISLLSNVSFSSLNTTINAINSRPVLKDAGTMETISPIALYFSGFHPVTLNITGDTVINSSATSGTGVLFLQSNWSGNIQNININNGSLTWTSSTGDAIQTKYSTAGAFGFLNAGKNVSVNVNLNNAFVSILADASSATRSYVPGFSSAVVADGSIVESASWVGNGFVFSGNGNVDIVGKSAIGDGINSRVINNSGLNGTFSLNGESESGTGVNLDRNLNVSLVNASVKGNSNTGVGVNISAVAGIKQVNLGNNKITGMSNTSSGIQLSGSNVSITNGTLNGTSMGSGSGIKLTGGNNYNFSGVNISGQSRDGAGVSVSGNLSVNDLTSLNGTSSGTGDGVVVTGNLQSTGGVTINGTSADGNGVAVSGNTSLTNATVSGNSTSGSGVNIAGQLTADAHTALNGTSVSGSGLMLSDASVTNASLSGNSTSGSGVIVSGSVSLDEHSAQNLNATSVSGSGLALSDTNITVVDDNGVAVTSPVELTGQSSTGSGITTSGNTTLNTVILNGTTSSDEGAGLTVSGNLTIGDTLSGLTGSTSGNGSGVVIDNATINTDSYTQAGKDFTINGSSTGNGTAIKAQGDNQLTNVTLNGRASGNGSAIEVSGNVTGGVIKGESSTVDGTAVDIVGNAVLSGTNVSGNASAGTGVSISGDASLNNATLDGQTQTGKGVDVSGSLTGSGSTTVAGNASGDGTGVDLGGNVTGGSISGGSVNGSGVTVSGNSTATNTAVSGNTTNGKGVDITGNLTNTGNSTVAGNASGNGTGTNISGTLNGAVTGSSETGTGVHVNDGAHISAGSNVTGSSDTGSGTVVEGNINNLGQISGTSNKGDGLNLNATVSGGGKLAGNSVDGTGVHVSGNSAMNGGSLSGSTTNGSGLHLEGNLQHSPDSTINSSVAIGGQGQESTGQGSIVEVKPPVEPGKPEFPVDKQVEKMMNVISRQQVITGQTWHRGTALQTSGYRSSEEPVEIEICVDGTCQSANVHRQLSSASEGK
ncbi:filamentous hemagglutinin N-terminal domain-containing protein [Salmonella enterica subsp. enterica]|nr:filamentous hemagglutinin N-terminal domain-containing protein [Salmonella enterica subsp. enterica serovar Hvittingfoss]EEJ7167036.1 filamentous hemagglutinin N-terminal domain-containing protein [Salmonella enterica subsp. enterica serovar Hvittingfoss]